jgi:hypothetical protein
MIAITITQRDKSLNDLSNKIGSILTKGEHPNVWWGEERVVGGYTNREDLHELDGWYNVVQPVIGENQKRGAIYFDADNDVFTYAIIKLTEQEIAQRLEISMPRRDFKVALLKNHEITNTDVDNLFSILIESDSEMLLAVEEMKIMWYESEVFTNTTPELFQFAGMMTSVAGIDLSEQDLKQIFIDHQNADV